MSVAQFRARPLAGTSRDRKIWIEPADAMETLGRAIEIGFNTIILGPPGAGVTSLLNQLVARLDDGDRSVKRVWAGPARTSTELLDVVSDALEGAEEPQESSGLAPALRRLDTAAREHPQALIVMDEVAGGPGHDVFGRMRDELWDLPVRWLLGVRDDEAGVLLEPPADAFFETVYRLAPLTADQTVMLLARRDPEHELDDALRVRIAEHSRGNPATALALARQALVLPTERRHDFLEADPVENVRAALGAPAAKLFSELLRRGPSGPSDDALLRRMNWSRPRAYQVFQQLERNGLIRSANDRPSGPGRPRKVYEVAQ